MDGDDKAGAINTARNSRVIRCAVLDISDPLNVSVHRAHIPYITHSICATRSWSFDLLFCVHRYLRPLHVRHQIPCFGHMMHV
jgi:hypothetical protein